jgi:quercetin dioxygenase-like cupin family protein
MTLAGRRFEVPGGAWVVITRAGEETGGEVVEVEFEIPPGTPGPPPHRHSRQVEEWAVLDGELRVRIGGRSRTLSAGESATIPPGTVHTFRNASSSVVRVRDVHRPGFGFDEYIVTLGRLAEAGKLRSLRDPRAAIYLSMVWRDHREMQVADSALLRAAMTALAGLGRLLGFRTTAA